MEIYSAQLNLNYFYPWQATQWTYCMWLTVCSFPTVQIHTLRFISTFSFSLPQFFFSKYDTFPLATVPNGFTLARWASLSQKAFITYQGAMFLSCWRDAIKPHPTVIIHILGPQKNKWRRYFTNLAEEKCFLCINQRTKVVKTGCKHRGMAGFHFRAKEMKEFKTSKEGDGSGPINLFIGFHADVAMVASYYSTTSNPGYC